MRYKPKTRPRRYQAEALKRAFECGVRYGLFLEPRTGKSKIAIDAAAALFLQGKVRIVLLVCQKSGLPVWEDELAKHCGIPYRLIVLPQGSKRRIAALKSTKRVNTHLTFVFLNYESTWRVEEGLVRMKPDMLICDESHKLKNHRAKQTKCIHRLVQAFDPYRLMLTGTSIPDNPLDVFSQYMAIDDSVFGRSWSKFKKRYAIFYGYYNRQVKYKNLPDLRRRARTKATVLTKEECLDLPKMAYEPLYVPLTGGTRVHYDSMERDFVTWLSEHRTASASIKLTQMMRLAQITGGFIKDDEGTWRQIGSEKLEVLEDQLETLLEANEKVVIFARFRAEVDAIEALCKRRRWKSYKYYGPVKGDRLRYPQSFQADTKPVVFIAQIHTGSLSINLAAAAYVVFYSFDYNLVDWIQAHDRVLAGQTRPVTYLYLLARVPSVRGSRNTTDFDIWQALQNKQEVSTLLHNNSRFMKKLLARPTERLIDAATDDALRLFIQ